MCCARPYHARTRTICLSRHAMLNARARAASVCASSSPDSNRLFAVRGTTCTSGSSEYGGVGVNIFDALWCGSTAMASPCNYTDVLGSLASLSQSGLRFFRFFASLHGDRQVQWLENPVAFWATFDRLMFDVQRLGLFVVVSLGAEAWHEVANRWTKATSLETLNDLVTNKSSLSRSLAVRYVDEVVRRYADRPEVLFWELGNELNLKTNMPHQCGTTTAIRSQQLEGANHSRRSSSTSSTSSSSSSSSRSASIGTATVQALTDSRCFNTSALVGYTRHLVDTIRRADPRRPISSGFAVTRGSAWHQERCRPSNAPRAPSAPSAGAHHLPLSDGDPCSDHGEGGVDTIEQWQRILLWQHAAVDIVSLHVYPGLKGCWFGRAADHACHRQNNITLLSVAARAAASVGKPLYVGEYGGRAPNFTGPTEQAQAFPEAVLRWQVESRTAVAGAPRPLSSIWSWSCPSKRATMRCAWPFEEGSARLVALLQAAERGED